MLYPQINKYRQIIDLSGFWGLSPDPDDLGEKKKWYRGFAAETVVGVPGSWNEQLAESGLMNYVGKVWYQQKFFTPVFGAGNHVYLRFGSSDFNARVWLNEKYLGEHRGGYLPFEFEVTDFLKSGAENLLVVCNDNMLDHDSIPQGITEADYAEFGREREVMFPSTVFDFFAYGGLSRLVQLYTRPEIALEKIRIHTRIDGKSGRVEAALGISQKPVNGEVRVSIYDDDKKVTSAVVKTESDDFNFSLIVRECKFWSPQDPHLYIMQIEIYDNGEQTDIFRQEFGIREIQVKGEQLLLNGKPVFLKGFGKHEDFAVLGRGMSFPLIVKDFQLMKWIGANSFRTSHYPYAEEVMQLADRMGFLVIDEVPAVSLNFRYVSKMTLARHKQMMSELIARDQNHPCVIAWSIGNEPGIWGEREAISKKAHDYWRQIYAHTRELDDTRPITLPACVKWKMEDPAFQYSDFICLNRYWGWYEAPGEPEKAGRILKNELQEFYEKFGKPVMLTEFGADTVEGAHATYPQMFSEEYQSELLQVYFDTIAGLPFMIGEHIWNFADFKTAQHHRRVILNKKGIFNRQREPKSAAFTVRRHWLKNKK